MITRRIALLGTAVAALIVAVPALAADDLKLPRQAVELGRSPVRASSRTEHQGRSKDHRVQTDDQGEGSRHRRCGYEIPGHDVQRLDAGADDGRP